jgi:outer membrane protein TolC
VLIGLDTVFRLAEDQNPQVRLAREKVREAYAERGIAKTRWLPELWIGSAYYRHEGGIQDFTGPLLRSSTGALFGGVELNGRLDLRDLAYQQVNAQRQVWQQKGELSRITSETLLEAACTYIDLLAARTGELIAREMETDLLKLRDRALKLAEADPAAQVEVARIKAELGGRQQSILKLRQQGNAASAKLAYLLGIDPCTDLQPIDSSLAPFDLVDATPPTCVLVERALTNGPGIRELEGLLGLIHESIDRANGWTSRLPVVGLRVAEGGFGAGANSTLDWDNRFDLGIQARWNLTEFLNAKERRRLAVARLQQAQIAYDDTKSKLKAGVEEARDAIHNGRVQIRLGEEQIRDAREAQDRSIERLDLKIPGSTHTEVLFAVRSLALAQVNYLTALANFDKAQLRLMVLLGPSACAGPTSK